MQKQTNFNKNQTTKIIYMKFVLIAFLLMPISFVLNAQNKFLVGGSGSDIVAIVDK